MTTSDIHIRSVEPQDFSQVTDLYFCYRSQANEFFGYCGRRVFRNYLKWLYASPQGSVWCAVTEEGRVIGFIVGIIDRERFDRHWLGRNLVWLGPVVMVKCFFSSKFRRLILTLLRAKLRSLGKRVPAAGGTDIPRLKQEQATGCWLVVDEAFRGGGKDVASRLILSRNQDLKRKGVARVYGIIARTNLASIFVHLKNGWQIIPTDGKSYLVVKDL